AHVPVSGRCDKEHAFAIRVADGVFQCFVHLALRRILANRSPRIRKNLRAVVDRVANRFDCADSVATASLTQESKSHDLNVIASDSADSNTIARACTAVSGTVGTVTRMASA